MVWKVSVRLDCLKESERKVFLAHSCLSLWACQVSTVILFMNLYNIPCSRDTVFVKYACNFYAIFKDYLSD
jgi:hypothetical protein